MNQADANMIKNYLNRKLVAGDGIVINRVGDQIAISLAPRVSALASPGYNVPSVDELPPIPTVGYACVYWTVDKQCWEAYAGQPRWTPCQRFTDASGEVV